ncbi:MAG: hypothetical protein CM1200mP25_4170 [Acidobacteriota bacterium]|nr:MAG: hypothetical protein CM1200mP25_4170 [Acidobacteriota bacterium]
MDCQSVMRLLKGSKLEGDRWRFNARVKYGNVDVTLPVVVRWSGLAIHR